MMHTLLSYRERHLFYKSNSFFQYLIISEVHNLLMRKYIFFEIFKRLVFLEKSLPFSVRFFQLFNNMKKSSLFKFCNSKSFQIRPRCITLAYLIYAIISYFRSFSSLMNCQSGLQQEPQGSVDCTLPKSGENGITDSRR